MKPELFSDHHHFGANHHLHHLHHHHHSEIQPCLTNSKTAKQFISCKVGAYHRLVHRQIRTPTTITIIITTITITIIITTITTIITIIIS